MDRPGPACEARPVSASSVKVLAVDDQRGFLDVIRAVVEATSGFRWAGGATSGADALTEADLNHPDLVLIDVEMPEMNGVEVARRLLTRYPGMLVALISAHRPDELPKAAAESGVGAILPKENLSPAWLRGFWQEHHS